MAAETGYTIDGVLYENITIDDLDTDERFILYEYSKIRQEDFAPQEDEENDQEKYLDRVIELTKNPGYWPALWHCAYRRVHTDKDFAEIRAIIGKAKFVQVMATFGEIDAEEDETPLASTSGPQHPYGNGSLENVNLNDPNTGTPGNDSQTSSDPPANDPVLTTALRSATSSISPQETSAA